MEGSSSDVEVAAATALARLDKAVDEVVDALSDCAEHVNQGRLSQDEMMLRLHQLSARLLAPPAT